MMFLDDIIAVGSFSVAVGKNLKEHEEEGEEGFYQVFKIDFLVLLVGFVVMIGFRRYSGYNKCRTRRNS
jgi:hypothetical protein